MTLDIGEGEFTIADSKSLWAGRRLYDLYEEASTPCEWHAPIFDRAREQGMICLQHPVRRDRRRVSRRASTPPCYKIASFEIIDLPLIRTRRPHRQADDHLDRHGQRRRDRRGGARPRARPAAATSRCSSAPAATRPPPENANLRTMPAPRRDLRLRRRPLRPHARHRRRGRGDRARAPR